MDFQAVIKSAASAASPRTKNPRKNKTKHTENQSFGVFSMGAPMPWKSRLLAQPPQRVSQAVIKSAAINVENVFGLEIGLPKQRTSCIDMQNCTPFWNHNFVGFQTSIFCSETQFFWDAAGGRERQKITFRAIFLVQIPIFWWPQMTAGGHKKLEKCQKN